jgi:hypothetical protein
MILTHILKNTLLSSFHLRIKRFGSIVTHFNAGKLIRAVVYRSVSRLGFSDLQISPILIGHHTRLPVNKTFNQRTKLGSLNTGNQRRVDLAPALGRYQDTLFLDAFAALVLETLSVTRFTAKVFFIQFNDTLQQLPTFKTWFHRLANRITGYPDGALSNSQPLSHEH